MPWNWLYKYIYLVIIAMRNPSLFRILKELKKSQKWSYAQLKSYQHERLIALLNHAYKYVPFWQDLFDRNPPDLSQPSELILKQLPIITKSDLIEKNMEMHSTYRFGKMIKGKTSGSTGQPLVFNKNEKWDSTNHASILRGYSWYQVNTWQKSGYLWGYRFRGFQKWETRIVDLFLNQFRLFSYDDKAIQIFTKKLRNATYLHGYTSVIAKVATQINKMGITINWQPKMIKYTSEKPNSGDLEAIEKAFGGHAISEYGSAESGLISFECPHGTHHINMESVIIEEENGEILVTNLNSLSFPIIRYKLGDLIKLGPVKKCACGLHTETLLEVTGRVGKPIYGKQKIYPSLTFYNVFKILNRDYHLPISYQIIQNQKGSIQVNMEESLSQHDLKRVDTIFREYFKDDMQISYFPEAEIPQNGKRKDFISLIEKEFNQQ